jgi:plasmid stabilization system protein ParE
MPVHARKRLEWSRVGLKELYDSIEFIAAENIQAAALVRNRIAAAAELLETHPLIGSPGQRAGTRELPIPNTPYTLVYSVGPRKVKIGRVLHQRRKYP